MADNESQKNSRHRKKRLLDIIVAKVETSKNNQIQKAKKVASGS